MSCLAQRPAVLNSREFVKSHGENPTLADDEYTMLADFAAEEVRRLCSNLSIWDNLWTKDGVEIFERKSDLKESSEPMLLAITTVNCTMEKLEKLVSPWLEYRLKWDDMLANVQIIKSFPDKEVYLARHMVRKLLTISARESIDVIKVARRDGETVFGSTGVAHADYPPVKGFVRTHQFLSGYLMRPSDENPAWTKFHMLFHADLNLAGPRLLTNMAVKFKPRLMCQKIDNLRKAIDQFDV